MKQKEGRQNPQIVDVRTSLGNMKTIEFLLYERNHICTHVSPGVFECACGQFFYHRM